MTDPTYDDDDGDDADEPTPENIRKALAELVRLGLIVDSRRRRRGRIVWITAEKAEAES
jgi:hypothetical protein